MILCGRYLLSLLLALSITQSATGLWWRDRVIAQVVKPTFEALIEWQLKADVQIGELALSATRLHLRALKIEKPGNVLVEVAEMEIGYSLSGIWRRQLETVRLQQPRVEITGLAENNDDIPVGFPERAPLEIADLRINDGALLLALGEKPLRIHALQVDLNGTRLPRFEASARLGEGAGLPFALAGTGNWDQLPGLTLARFDWDGTPLLDEPLQFQLNRSGTQVSGNIRLPRLNRATLERMASILALPLSLPAQLDFSVESPEIILSLKPAELILQLNVPTALVQQGATQITLGAVYTTLHRKDQRWDISGRFTLGKTVQASYTANYTGDHRLTGEITGVIGDVDSLLTRFSRDWKRTLSGGALLKGEFSAIAGKLTLLADLSGRPVPTPKPDYRLDISPLKIRLNAEFSDDSLQGTGNILLADRELANFFGSGNQLEVQLHAVSWKELSPLAGPKLLPDAIVDFSGLAGVVKLQHTPAGNWQGNVAVAADRIQGSEVELTELTANGRFSSQDQEITLKDLRLASRASLPNGNCRLSGAASATLNNSQYRIELAALNIAEGEFFSRDGTSALTGGYLRSSGNLVGDLRQGQIGIDMQSRFGAAEILHGGYYANMTENEGQLGLKGSFDRADRRLQAEQLTIDIPDLLRAQGEGSLSAAQLELRASLRSADLGRAFARFAKQPLEAAASDFKDLQLSGLLNADLSIRKSAETFAVGGTLYPQGLGLQLSTLNLELAGLNGNLPLSYSLKAPESEEESRPGELRFDTLRLGPVQLEKAPIQLLSSTNRLQFSVFPKGHLAEGQMRVADMEIGITEGQPQAAARILITDVNLEQLTRELNWPSMRGELSADLGEIRYADGELRSAGEARIDVFNGSMVISKIRLRDLGSAYRTLNGDIDLQGIDLYLLTRTFEFGEMNGILDGKIHNLRLFGNTPSQFEAELSTREDGRRNVSVKALNNLSILSQGGLSAALSQGIYQFIDFYRYQKIGVRCTLNNDLFRLTGTARNDSDEYLVYGGLLPPKIDIIAPERDISFKEMLKRLSRIDRAGR